MGKLVLNAISGVLVAVVAVVAILFFWGNPFRVGEITLVTPKGTSMTVKVANSNEISELIRNGLENVKTASILTYSLLSIIGDLPPGSALGEKLVELVERRQSPFSFTSVPVKLVYNPNVPPGLAAVCESSDFLVKTIVVYVLNNDGELIHTPLQAYVDVRQTFPCPSGGETVAINSMEVREFSQHKVLAKRTF